MKWNDTKNEVEQKLHWHKLFQNCSTVECAYPEKVYNTNYLLSIYTRSPANRIIGKNKSIHIALTDRTLQGILLLYLLPTIEKLNIISLGSSMCLYFFLKCSQMKKRLILIEI